MKMNRWVMRPLGPAPKTHEGGRAVRINAENQLMRLVSSCFLWEKEFYVDGGDIATQITLAARAVPVEFLANTAVLCRQVHNLRHTPLLLCLVLADRARGSSLVADTIDACIQRPDEITELLALHWSAGRKAVPHQMLKGIARAFQRCDAYGLAKYDRAGPVRLRDALRLSHPRPSDDDQSKVFKQLLTGTLPVPDTWEVALSRGDDKKIAWTRLITEGKLGALAYLRNLRNMISVGVPDKVISEGLLELSDKALAKVFPFRFIAAARYAPRMEPYLEALLFRRVQQYATLAGHTTLLVDVSGSMIYPLSQKSDMTRMDAACGLAMVLREMSPEVSVYTFSDRVVEVPNRKGFALRDSIVGSQRHNGTQMGHALNHIPRAERLIVITDEQTQDQLSAPNAERAYMINVASAHNGVGYQQWVHLDGFSEGVVQFLLAYEEGL